MPSAHANMCASAAATLAALLLVHLHGVPALATRAALAVLPATAPKSQGASGASVWPWEAARGRRAPPPSRDAPYVCVVTTGCDDVADPGTGTRRLRCAEGAGGGNSGGGNNNSTGLRNATTTLRACIESVNAHDGGSAGAAQRIEFAPGVTTVSPVRAFPSITAPHTTIDGLAGRWAHASDHARLAVAMVHINGSAVLKDDDYHSDDDNYFNVDEDPNTGLVSPPAHTRQ